MRKTKFNVLQTGFLNCLFYGIGMIQTKLDEVFYDSTNIIEYHSNDRYLIVTLQSNQMAKKPFKYKYYMRLLPNSDNTLTKIVSIEEIK